MIKTLYPCFQHWSEKGSVYIISDTHFNDPDRKFMGYKISEQEQLYLIKESCKKNDTLIHLGDVGFPYFMDSIKAHKVLVMGNHDTGETKKWFDEVYDGPLWVSQKLVLSHEVLDLTCGFDTPIAYNIHGHDHGFFDKSLYSLNLAQNVYGYVPLNLKEFINSGALKNISSIHRQTINYQTMKAREKNSSLFEEGFSF